MALAGERTLSTSLIRQRIDLSEFFDESLSDDVKEEIGQAFIDRIVERSEKGRDVNGASLRAYSNSYKESEDFARFGKSASQRNMTLTGEMLESIDISVSGDTLDIEIDDNTQAAKAHGNITGKEGEWRLKRDFFGVTNAEVRKIAREIKDKYQGDLDVTNQSRVLLNAFVERQQGTQEQVLNALFNNIFNVTEEL